MAILSGHYRGKEDLKSPVYILTAGQLKVYVYYYVKTLVVANKMKSLLDLFSNDFYFLSRVESKKHEILQHLLYKFN